MVGGLGVLRTGELGLRGRIYHWWLHCWGGSEGGGGGWGQDVVGRDRGEGSQEGSGVEGEARKRRGRGGQDGTRRGKGMGWGRARWSQEGTLEERGRRGGRTRREGKGQGGQGRWEEEGQGREEGEVGGEASRGKKGRGERQGGVDAGVCITGRCIAGKVRECWGTWLFRAVGGLGQEGLDSQEKR